MRVLIADDEFRVCKVIEKLIDWDALEMELVGVAATGVEEYEMIEKYRPDIVITDIRMPGIDGLQVIEKVRQQGWQIDFIVVSGYKYFDYAYNALKFGVEDYLLKPIQKEELNTILSKISLARNEKEQIYKKQKDLENERESSQRILYQSFFNRLFHAGTDETMELEEMNESFRLGFRAGKFLCYAMIVDGVNFEKSESETVLSFTNTLYKKMKEHMAEYDIFQNIAEVQQVWIYGILNYEGEKSTGRNALQECFENMQKFTQNFHGYSITLSAGAELNNCRNLAEEMKLTADNLKARLVMGVNRILWKDEIKEGEQIGKDIFIEDYESLKRAVTSESREKIEYELKEAFRKLNQYEEMNFSQYYETVFHIIDICYIALGEEDELKEDKNRLCLKVTQLYLKSNIRSYVIHSLSDTIEKYYQTKKQKETKPVRLVKNYLEVHYAEPVGLEEAADMADLNPVYLSVLFKRSTGINFNDYLTKLRVDAAKKLLADTNMSIGEIGEKVGYGNGKYFSQVFSKSVGLNPTVYRKLHS